MGQFILQERRDQVLIIRLNRPDRLNAWHAPMRDELVTAFIAANRDEAVRAVVLTGSGDQAFSAGQDLSETEQFDADRAVEWLAEWRTLYGSIRDMDKPVVAALNGVAAGSAFQVALLTDIRVGHAGSRMGQPEIDSGIPSTLGPWLMWDSLGWSRTVELTLTGRMMDGEECHRLGLIHELVSPDQVLPRAIEIAQQLAAKPPIAMKLNKQHFRTLTQAGFQAAEEAGVRIQREAFASGEPQTAMAQFFAERAARKQQSGNPPTSG